jgi:hypothetical protein
MAGTRDASSSRWRRGRRAARTRVASRSHNRRGCRCPGHMIWRTGAACSSVPRSNTSAMAAALTLVGSVVAVRFPHRRHGRPSPLEHWLRSCLSLPTAAPRPWSPPFTSISSLRRPEDPLDLGLITLLSPPGFELVGERMQMTCGWAEE